jgi:hypothetical protein
MRTRPSHGDSGGQPVNVFVIEDVRRRSTEAARAYVLATRQRMGVQLERGGAGTRESRNFQQLERSISREALARTWPQADLDEALAE